MKTAVATQTVRVEVRDVDPVIGGLDEPESAYEIAYMPYTMNATPGAPGDPIIRYEWDINPAAAAADPDPEYAGADTSTIRHQFHDAGQYNMTITVRDGDSASRVTRLVNVVEITLLQLIEHIQVRIDEEIAAVAADGELDPVLPFADVGPLLERALWGENNGYRGNTLLALRGVVERMAEAQQNGVRLGLETWALARQLRREVSRQRADILAGDPAMAQDLSIQRADVFLVKSMPSTARIISRIGSCPERWSADW